MSLVEEETVTSIPSGPLMWIASTRRPPGTGVCSSRTIVSGPSSVGIVSVEFGQGCPRATTFPAIWSVPMLAEPLEPEHEVTECEAISVAATMGRTPRHPKQVVRLLTNTRVDIVLASGARHWGSVS